MDKVALVKCEDYDIKKVKAAVREAVDHLGGIAGFVKPGEKVLLKVNLLLRRKPEKVTTTHPAVAQALAELVIEAGGKPVIADSPGGYHFYNKGTLESVYNTCGMTEAATNSGAGLNYDTNVIDISYPEGRLIKNIKVIKPIIEYDKIINIPKLKTHMMTVYSGAVKNLFGIIPGSYKAEYHLRFEDAENFADLLIDLCSFVKPVLTVMDAVIGMEGYGPTNGTPKKVGLVLASTNPFALDAVASRVIGLDSIKVPTVRKSVELGLCSGKLSDTLIVGETLENVYVKDFKKPTVKVSFNFYNIFLPKFLSRWMNRVLNAHPVFDYKYCKRCRMCEKSCPPKAIEMIDGYPHVDYGRCIRCFCCHELCKYEAVKIKRPLFLRFFLK